MKYQPNEDLFKDTTMTFGEHLEELRVCLFRALVGLVVGVLIGLAIGKPVVEFVNAPLAAALEEFHRGRSTERVEAQLADWKTRGIAPPFTLDEAKRAIDARMVPDKIYIADNLLKSSPGKPAHEPAEKTVLDQALEKLRLVPIYIWRPLDETDLTRPTSFGMQETFMIYMKASVVAGILFSSPWLIYQIWSFVAAGLYPHEKHYIHIFLPFSLGLFLAGAALAFFFVFKPVLSFLLSFNEWLGIDPDPRISDWFNFVLVLPLGFGISFQLPLVMLFLERIGIFDAKAYVEKWRIAIFTITIISAVLTPADPYSLLLMAIPLTFLYFGGVLLCKYMPRGTGEQRSDRRHA